LGECLRIGPSRNIGPAEVGFATGPTYFLHGSVAGRRVATNDQHPGSFGGENLGDTFADPSTGAGDNRSLGVQSTSHLKPFNYRWFIVEPGESAAIINSSDNSAFA
jgi:hypothetical protein